MKTLQDIANLITVRDFLSGTINNESIKLSKDDWKNVRAQIQVFDKVIVEHSLKLNLTNFGQEQSKQTLPSKRPLQAFSRESTEDTEVVARKFGIASKPTVSETGVATIEAPTDDPPSDE